MCGGWKNCASAASNAELACKVKHNFLIMHDVRGEKQGNRIKIENLTNGYKS